MNDPETCIVMIGEIGGQLEADTGLKLMVTVSQ
jgi:succinyl-CoA synthetase alpha subunit